MFGIRRTSTCVAVLGLALLAVAAPASAAPTVGFKAEVVPIPGFPHTGNILGAGADVSLEITVEGSEYFGSPPPIIGFNFYVPKGVVLNQSGFPTCPEDVLVDDGPGACPKGSSLGPVGTVLGFVTFGGERVEESAELFSFFRPGGGVEYLADGHTPAVIEIVSTGHYTHLSGIDGYGFELEEEIPLVASVPGAPYASVKTVSGTFGAAIRTHGKTIYYARVPKTCPQGGFPVKIEAIFAENGEPSKPEAVSLLYKLPCPRR